MKSPLIQVRELIPSSDIAFLARNLRKVDKAEIKAFNGMSPLKGLKQSIEGSDEVWVVTIENIPVMIYGLADDASTLTKEELGNEDYKSAIVWAMGTDEVFKHKRELHKFSKKILARFLKDFELVYNYVWEGNKEHIKWLKKVGFAFIEDGDLMSQEEEVFKFFIMLRPVHEGKNRGGGPGFEK